MYSRRVTVTTLSEALRQHEGESSVTSVGADVRLVVLAHEDEWRAGFHLSRTSGSTPWRMEEFAALYVGQGVAAAEGIRRLPIGGLLARARKLVSPARPKATPGPFVSPSAIGLAGFRESGRGRGRRTDRDFAELAMEYVMLIQEGDRSPAKTISERTGGGSPAVWANRISEARKRGLLTEVRPGQSGGELTEKAHELLFGADPDDE
jgi:hypothetical protein